MLVITKRISAFTLATLFWLSLSLNSFSQERTITVNTKNPVTPIQPNKWGIFFEDIYMAADGGIYDAPLFAQVEGWQRNPNRIWFGNLKSYGTDITKQRLLN